MENIRCHTLVQNNPECVVLLHGLCRTYRSMSRLEKALFRAGYDVVNVDYPSRHHPIARLAKGIYEALLERVDPNGYACLHFVTHSMGGIIVRHILGHHLPKNLGRVVMISPPNQGSELVDRLKHLTLYRLVNGPAGLELGTGKNDLPQRLGPAHFDLGVITGRKSVNLILSTMLPGDNDGKVSSRRARLAGMRDFLVVDATHPFIMKNNRVIHQVLFYLENGRFEHVTIRSIQSKMTK
jgi:pimeloyl-ACP methyl ester carboxylesterase